MNERITSLLLSAIFFSAGMILIWFYDQSIILEIIETLGVFLPIIIIISLLGTGCILFVFFILMSIIGEK